MANLHPYFLEVFEGEKSYRSFLDSSAAPIFFVENFFGRKFFSSKTPCRKFFWSKNFFVEKFFRRKFSKTRSFDSIGQNIFVEKFRRKISSKIFFVENFFRRKLRFVEKNFDEKVFRRKKFSTKKIGAEKWRCQVWCQNWCCTRLQAQTTVPVDRLVLDYCRLL